MVGESVWCVGLGWCAGLSPGLCCSRAQLDHEHNLFTINRCIRPQLLCCPVLCLLLCYAVERSARTTFPDLQVGAALLQVPGPPAGIGCFKLQISCTANGQHSTVSCSIGW